MVLPAAAIVDSATSVHDVGERGGKAAASGSGGDYVTSGVGRLLARGQRARTSRHRISSGKRRRRRRARAKRVWAGNVFRRHRSRRRFVVYVLESGDDDAIS